jgi:DNA-binding CsgD family transcriptional regulator
MRSSTYFLKAVQRLRHADLEGVIQVAGELAAIDETDTRPFPPYVLESLRRLVGSDVAAYTELDRIACRVLDCLAVPNGEHSPGVEVFWALRHEHPCCNYEDRTLDFSTRRVSDFMSSRELRRSQLYADWFRPLNVEFEISVGLAAPLTHTKVFLFDNARTSGDFDERERTILELLRPHLTRRYAYVEPLRRADFASAEPLNLTAREREVLRLVAEGNTDAQVAAALWVSPRTVGKHLENAYEKLGVTNRTAAARRIRDGA